ncbi:MAG: acetolactate synthase small subunit [Clostridiales bacterium]|jgi:acetolactate synthase-1/3 small subunit|nr:acetolactate synthase small subunit [Clostridiales bacterium]
MEKSMEKRYTLSILVQNNAGVLRRVASLFARRNYNIESLAVGETEDEAVSRITVVTVGDEYIVEQITSQVAKLTEVYRVEIMEPANTVFREMMFIKVKTGKNNRAEIIEVANIFRARVIDVATTSLVFEITGDAKKLKAFLELMAPFHIIEIVRTGTAAIQRGDNRFLNRPVLATNRGG